MRKLLRTFVTSAACVIVLTVVTGLTAFANVPSQNPTTGQRGAPTNTCGDSNPITPGNTMNSPGSPFNPNGQAGVVYAGNPNTASLAHSNSTATVSQYDVACIELSGH